MNIILDLRPEVEAQLLAQANARGLSLHDYLNSIVELQARTQPAVASAEAMSHAEWEREFEAFIDSFPQQPVLSDEAIGRDSIYTREDEL